MELLFAGAHEEVLGVVLEKRSFLIFFGHLARPEIRVIESAWHHNLGNTCRTRRLEPPRARAVDAVHQQIRELMRGDVHYAGQLAQPGQGFQRAPAGSRGVKEHDLIARIGEPPFHLLDARRRTSER